MTKKGSDAADVGGTLTVPMLMKATGYDEARVKRELLGLRAVAVSEGDNTVHMARSRGVSERMLDVLEQTGHVKTDRGTFRVSDDFTDFLRRQFGHGGGYPLDCW